MQQNVFVRRRSHGFWGGLVGVRDGERQQLMTGLDADAWDVFPITLIAAPELTAGTAAFVVTTRLRVAGGPQERQAASAQPPAARVQPPPR